MKATNVFLIYTPRSFFTKRSLYDKTTKQFKEFYNIGGVYVIFKKMTNVRDFGKIIPLYVGSSYKNVGKACIRHFYGYNDAIRYDQDRKVEYNRDLRYRVSFKDDKYKSTYYVKFYYDFDSKEDILKKEGELINKLATKYNVNGKTAQIEEDLILQDKLQEQAEQNAQEIDEDTQNYLDYLKEKEEAEDNRELPPPDEEPPF
jgi:hypothetical protein